MGITGGNYFEEKTIGSNTLNVIQSINIPVIIVPKSCKYQFITKVTLLTDYNNLEKNLPEEKLLSFIENINPRIEVLYFDLENKREHESVALEKFYLNYLLDKYSPNYSYSLRSDFENAVNELAKENDSQLIINISKNKSWFQKLFNPSYTAKLAFHSKLPLLVLRN